MGGNKAVGIVFDDRHVMASRDRGDCRAARLGNCQRGRVLQRRIEVERLGLQFDAGVRERVGVDSLGIHGKPH